jgi:hypothetical protein
VGNAGVIIATADGRGWASGAGAGVTFGAVCGAADGGGAVGGRALPTGVTGGAGDIALEKEAGVWGIGGIGGTTGDACCAGMERDEMIASSPFNFSIWPRYVTMAFKSLATAGSDTSSPRRGVYCLSRRDSSIMTSLRFTRIRSNAKPSDMDRPGGTSGPLEGWACWLLLDACDFSS